MHSRVLRNYQKKLACPQISYAYRIDPFARQVTLCLLAHGGGGGFADAHIIPFVKFAKKDAAEVQQWVTNMNVMSF